jgi:hypothetical protein
MAKQIKPNIRVNRYFQTPIGDRQLLEYFPNKKSRKAFQSPALYIVDYCLPDAGGNIVEGDNFPLPTLSNLR